MNDFSSLLKKTAEDFKITLSDEQLEKFSTYYELLVEWNEKMNLTALVAPYDVVLKHFCDSLMMTKFVDIKENATMIDIGTGAGFPGIPLKIFRNDIKLTLLDSLNKRLVFLKEVCDRLSIEAKLIHSRAEDGAKSPDLREKFDIATSRAVASLPVLCEYCLPYVKVGGQFVSYKGKDAEEELDSAKPAIKILGGKTRSVDKFDLADAGERCIISIDKKEKTPKVYPRPTAKIKKKTL